MYAYKSVRCTIVRKQRWWEKNGIFGNWSLAFVFSSRQFQCTYMWTFNWVVVDDTWLHGGWGIYHQYTHHGNHPYPNLELKRRPNFLLQYSWPWPEQFLDLRNQPINRNCHFHPATVFVLYKDRKSVILTWEGANGFEQICDERIAYPEGVVSETMCLITNQAQWLLFAS